MIDSDREIRCMLVPLRKGRLIVPNAPSISRALLMPRITPPTSDLWDMFSEITFMATGKPISSAIASASEALWAGMLLRMGMRNDASRPLDSARSST